MVDSKRKVHVDKMHPELWDNQGKQSAAELGQAQDKLEVIVDVGVVVGVRVEAYH